MTERRFKIRGKTVEIIQLGWKGELFQWNDFRFNGGNSFTSYRFGPIQIRVWG